MAGSMGSLVCMLAVSLHNGRLVLVEGEEVSDCYELTTLQDVFDKLPADKINLCLQEIGEGLAKSKLIVEGMKALMGDAWRDDMMNMQWPITWIDDDGCHGEFQFYDKESGDKIGSIGISLKEQKE